MTTIPFYKLHVAGDDFIIIDEEKIAAQDKQDTSLSPLIMRETFIRMLDRFCGVGGAGCILVRFEKEKESVHAHLFGKDGKEKALLPDAVLCIARLAMDTGRIMNKNNICIQDSLTQALWKLVPIDSRSFLLGLPWPVIREIRLFIDGKSIPCCRVSAGQTYTVALAIPEIIRTARIHQALRGAVSKNSIPVLARLQGQEKIQFIGPEQVDRLEGAMAATVTAIVSGCGGSIIHDDTLEILVEWRGHGGALMYASQQEPLALMDRGRFLLEGEKGREFRIVGRAEYAFEGTFDG
jgi:hypothetical protein